MASIEELFAAYRESHDRMHAGLVKCLALLTKMEEESRVATTEETQDDVLDEPLSLDAVPDAQLHPVAVPCVQIDNDGSKPLLHGKSTTEEILVAAPGTQPHLIVNQSKPVPVEVVPFRDEHRLALVREVFDGMPGTDNYIIVDHKEEHTLGRLAVRPLHLVVQVLLRCCCDWRTPRRWCVRGRLHADSTGVWRPPWPPPSKEQLGLTILRVGLRSLRFTAASTVLPFLVGATIDYLGLFIPTQGTTAISKVKIWPVLSDMDTDDGFEHHYWDPGLAAESVFMDIGRSRAGFHWDPGSLEGLHSRQFSEYSADFAPAHHHELHIAWPYFILLTHQKGGGYPGRDRISHMLACGGYCSQLHYTDKGYSTVELDSTVVGQVEAMFVHKLLSEVDNWDQILNPLLIESYSVQGTIGVMWVVRVPGQWCSIYSEIAVLGDKFAEPMSIRSPIQGHYVLMLDISGSPYNFPAITVANESTMLLSGGSYCFHLVNGQGNKKAEMAPFLLFPAKGFGAEVDRYQTLCSHDVIIHLLMKVVVVTNFALEDGWLQCQSKNWVREDIVQFLRFLLESLLFTQVLIKIWSPKD